MQRLVRPGQLAPRIEAEQILAQVHRVLGRDELGIQVVGQLDVFLTKHECRGRFGADHGVTVADGVAQNPEVAQSEVTGVIDVADDQRSHARAALAGGHEHVDLGLVQDGHDRLGKLMIIIIGVDIDEVDHARARLMRPRSGEPQPLPPASERSAPDPGQNPMPGDPQDALDPPAVDRPGHQEVGDDGKPAGQPCPHLEAGKDPVTRRQAVILDEARPWPRA